jgi:hypothetical protein
MIEIELHLAGQLGLTGGAQPIFLKQLRFDPTVWIIEWVEITLGLIIFVYIQIFFF